MCSSDLSRSQQQQQNDVLLQWKKWCDDYSFNLARQYGMFVGGTLTGFVIKDSLMRLLDTLVEIHMARWERSCHGRRPGKISGTKVYRGLFEQYTWNLEGWANQLFPPTVLNPLFVQSQFSLPIQLMK